MQKQKIQFLFLSILSALLFSRGWFPAFNYLILIAWVPLLFIVEKIIAATHVKRKKMQVIWYSYFTFFVWNLLTTWWIYYASFAGVCMAIVCNSTIMCAVFMIWYNLKLRINKSWSVWLLIPIWLAYEYGHTLWDLTWSWLVLGNSFAFSSKLVQWYEFTGTSGGSLWILIVSISVFQLIKKGDYSFIQILKPLAIIVLPIILSYIIVGYRQKKMSQTTLTSYKTLIVQPNVDPYNDKFFYEPSVQLHNLLIQIKDKLDSSISFLVLPETFLTEDVFEGREASSYSIPFLKDSILRFYPNLNIISGAGTVKVFQTNEPLTVTARAFSDGNGYYDQFNTAMQLNKEGLTWYHKSKLVPGVERMPFPALFKPLEKFAIDLGGTVGSLGTQETRTVFYSQNHQIGIAPVICYESIYSDFVREYIKQGANFIFILTNDGWWEDTPGYKQHLAFAKLRAIETRREIARCANTGVSCFINPLGDIEQPAPYWQKAMLIKNMTPQHNMTFFVRFGDLISYISSIMAILLFIWSQILRFKKS